MKTYFTFILFFTFGASSFAQNAATFAKEAKNLLDKNDNIGASINAIKALRTEPKNNKAQEVLSLSFELATTDLKNKIENLQAESVNFIGDITVIKRDEVYSLYVSLRELVNGYDEISRTVESKKYDLEFNRISYKEGMANSKELLQSSKQKAAEMHYSEAIKLMTSDDRISNKNAAKKFKKAFNYVENFKDAKALYEEAKVKGSTHLLILNFDNNSNSKNFDNIETKITNNLMEKMMEDPEIMEFTVFENATIIKQKASLNGVNLNGYPLNLLKENRSILGVDAVVLGEVTTIDKILHPIKNYEAVKYKKSVDSGNVEKYLGKDGKYRTRSIWIDVYAEVYKHEKKAETSVSASISYIDLEYDDINTYDINEIFIFSNMWITYSGDSRAINLNNYSNRDDNELNYPTDNICVTYLAPKIAQNITSRIKNQLK